MRFPERFAKLNVLDIVVIVSIPIRYMYHCSDGILTTVASLNVTIFVLFDGMIM